MKSLAIVALLAATAQAASPSFHQLTTGNGFGFSVFDASQGKLVQFLERPYRYLHPGATKMDSGVERRNLAYDVYFGVRAGSASGWMKDQPQSLVELVEQTNVIHSVGQMGGMTVESYFFAPFGMTANGVVALVKVTNTTGAAQPVSVFLNPNFHLGTAGDPNAPGADGEVIATAADQSTETGPGGGVMVYLPIDGWDLADCSGTGYARVMAGQDLAGTPTGATGNDLTIVYQKNLGTLAPGATAWWGAALVFAPDGNTGKAAQAWKDFLHARPPEQLVPDALAEWDAWRVPQPAGMSSDETRIWRQAEATLRMGQILEPYSTAPVAKNHGMIVASLPPGQWHIPWVRDQSYATVALARMGHHDEARLALDSLLNAEAGDYQSYTQTPYRISVVRYFGNGHEEADWNADGPNVEFDGWGLTLWAARTYIDVSGDTSWLSSQTREGDTVYAALRDGVVAPLEKNIDTTGMMKPDTSIWESHWNQRKHYAFTTFAAARGLCDFGALAATMSDEPARADAATRSRSLTEAARAQLLDPNLVLAASVEQLHGGAYHDAAVLESINWQLYPATDPLVAATTSSLATALHVTSGGLMRNDTYQSTYDSSEWIFVDLRTAGALATAGKSDLSAALVSQVVTNATPNFDLLPELLNDDSSAGAIGTFAGATPMVGFGAGAYVLAMLDRSGAKTKVDCGAAMVPDMPDMPTPTGGCEIGDGGETGEAGTVVLLLVLVLMRRVTRYNWK